MNDVTLDQFPDLATFRKYKEKKVLCYDDGSSTNAVDAEFFEKEVDGNLISVGMFSFKAVPLFCAWGYKQEDHCSYHAVMMENGEWSKPEKGCPIKIAIKNDAMQNIGLAMPTSNGKREFYFT